MTRPELTWFRLYFPREIEPSQLEQLLRALHGLSSPYRRERWVFQLVARRNQLEHYLAVPPHVRGAAERQAVDAVPGLRLEPQDPPALPRTRLAWRVWCSTSRRPLRREQAETSSRMLLSGLATTEEHEAVWLQWQLGPKRRPLVVTSNHSGQLSESWPRALALAPVLGPHTLDYEERKFLRDKTSVPGWRAVCRIGITTTSPKRARQLLRSVGGALRAAEGPGTAIGVRPIPRAWADGLRAPWRWGLALSVLELVPLLGWPLGEVGSLPVSRRHSRLLPVPASVPHKGRVLALEPDTDRPIALSPGDSRTHAWVIGPTGTGKSTLLTSLICQDMAAGRAVVVVEPKGDLINDLLQRIPPERVDDVVVLSPTDSAPVGLNPFQGGRPELVADQLLSMLARMHDSWGPRLSQILGAGLLTLARTPGANLAVLPALLSNSSFRRRIVSRIDDPLGVTPIWHEFDALSEDGQAQVAAAALNKIRPLVLRPDLRAVLGQADPKFSLRQVFTERKILLVDLAKGVVGPEVSRLFGTLLVNQLWQHSLARSAIDPKKRHLTTVFLDEFQDFATLGDDFGDGLAQARGLGVAFALAHQHTGQLSERLVESLISNARSRIVFQAASQDASLLAKGHPEITAEDFTSLPAYEVYLRLSVNGAVTPYMSGRTQLPPPSISDPEDIRARSRARYGQSRQVTDQALEDFITGPRVQGTPVIGTRRRSQ